MTNPIAQAYREGVERFKRNFGNINGYGEDRVGQLQSHHKHTALELLRACLEGVGEDKPLTGTYQDGYNTAKAEVRELIDGAIKEIENSV